MAGANTRIVRCCHCRGMMRVTARAMSVFCPHCHKRVTLEDLRIIGSHPGKTLATCGDILVEPPTSLNLDITANHVLIRGRVRGNVFANESIEVAPTGRVIGDVRAPKIIVREGGVIQGRCRMVPPQETPGVPQDEPREDRPPPERPAGPEAASSPSPPARQIRSVRLG